MRTNTPMDVNRCPLSPGVIQLYGGPTDVTVCAARDPRKQNGTQLDLVHAACDVGQAHAVQTPQARRCSAVCERGCHGAARHEVLVFAASLGSLPASLLIRCQVLGGRGEGGGVGGEARGREGIRDQTDGGGG